jgi:hypothetical protein
MGGDRGNNNKKGSEKDDTFHGAWKEETSTEAEILEIARASRRRGAESALS